MTDIFKLICRTCIKPTKQLFNIFTHSTNNNLISDLIMDCTPMRVAVNDGYPTNVCNDCIEKLNSIYNFKTMVMESDLKLRQYYTIFDTNKVCVDEITNTSSIPLVKPEFNELALANGTDDPNENKPDSLDVNNQPIAQNDVHMECSIDDDESISNNSMVEFDDITKEEPSVQPEINQEIECNIDEVQTESTIENSDNDGVINTEGAKTKCDRLRRNVNEEQVRLLNNADFNRIMSMGLTKKEKNRTTIFCPDCNKSFTFRYFVDVHAHVHTGNLQFKCEKCDRRFPKRVILKAHLKCHRETKDFKCKTCGAAFKTINCLRIHDKKHLSDRPFKCHLCPKAFKFSGILQTHIRRHLNEKTHVCEVCGKAYSDAGALYNHRSKAHDPDRLIRRFPCEICGKKYSSKSGLQNHIKRYHADRRPHVCEKCGRSFFNATILKQHMFIHTGEKPYSCRLCGKKFRQKGCITQHMRIHTGETPHPCKYCTARFKHSHHLRGHIKAHHKDKLEEQTSQDEADSNLNNATTETNA